jgi:hypothetical protein
MEIGFAYLVLAERYLAAGQAHLLQTVPATQPSDAPELYSEQLRALICAPERAWCPEALTKTL